MFKPTCAGQLISIRQQHHATILTKQEMPSKLHLVVLLISPYHTNSLVRHNTWKLPGTATNIIIERMASLPNAIPEIHLANLETLYKIIPTESWLPCLLNRKNATIVAKNHTCHTILPLSDYIHPPHLLATVKNSSSTEPIILFPQHWRNKGILTVILSTLFFSTNTLLLITC